MKNQLRKLIMPSILIILGIMLLGVYSNATEGVPLSSIEKNYRLVNYTGIEVRGSNVKTLLSLLAAMEKQKMMTVAIEMNGKEYQPTEYPISDIKFNSNYCVCVTDVNYETGLISTISIDELTSMTEEQMQEKKIKLSQTPSLIISCCLEASVNIEKVSSLVKFLTYYEDSGTIIAINGYDLPSTYDDDVLSKELSMYYDGNNDNLYTIAITSYDVNGNINGISIVKDEIQGFNLWKDFTMKIDNCISWFRTNIKTEERNMLMVIIISLVILCIELYLFSRIKLKKQFKIIIIIASILVILIIVLYWYHIFYTSATGKRDIVADMAAFTTSQRNSQLMLFVGNVRGPQVKSLIYLLNGLESKAVMNVMIQSGNKKYNSMEYPIDIISSNRAYVVDVVDYDANGQICTMSINSTMAMETDTNMALIKCTGSAVNDYNYRSLIQLLKELEAHEERTVTINEGILPSEYKIEYAYPSDTYTIGILGYDKDGLINRISIIENK